MRQGIQLYSDPWGLNSPPQHPGHPVGSGTYDMRPGASASHLHPLQDVLYQRSPVQLGWRPAGKVV